MASILAVKNILEWSKLADIYAPFAGEPSLRIVVSGTI